LPEVLGPYRRDEAIEIFKVIDDNESGDIRLEEMVWTVVEAGRIRHAIYQQMTDINHCINTFD
jgi:Ca2+-binding EF-hand superfamily protein